MATGTPFLTSAGSERRGSTSSEGSLTTSTTHTKSPCTDTPELNQGTRIRTSAAAKPASDPLQFVKVGPCNLYRSAQEQLRKAEEIKKQTAKDVRREQLEDWQSNLDNWKSSRRKQVEHIIERCVEVKRLESEDGDKTRRRAKTFNEMMEDRAGRRHGRAPLPLYNMEDNNDLSDLGIGTSSASGKSSLSEDCDNHSLTSDGMELDKNHSDSDNLSNNGEVGNRKVISDTAEFDNSTSALISSPEPEEYTYEGAIQNYKSRIISKSLTSNKFHNTTNTNTADKYQENVNAASISMANEKNISIIGKTNDKFSSDLQTRNDKKQSPKMEVLKRIEMFGKDDSVETNTRIVAKTTHDLPNVKSVKERLSHLEKLSEDTSNSSKVGSKVIINTSTVKDRMYSLEKSVPLTDKSNLKFSNGDLDNITPIKDRLLNLNTRNSPEKKTEKDVTPATVSVLKDRLMNFESSKNKCKDDGEDLIRTNNETNISAQSIPKYEDHQQMNVVYLNDSDEVMDSKKLHKPLDCSGTKNIVSTEKLEMNQSLEHFCENNNKNNLTEMNGDKNFINNNNNNNVSNIISQDNKCNHNENTLITLLDVNSQSNNHLNESAQVDIKKNNDVHQTSQLPFVSKNESVKQNSGDVFSNQEEEEEEEEENTVKSLDMDNSIFDALDSAFQIIDSEDHKVINSDHVNFNRTKENLPKKSESQMENHQIISAPLYENIDVLHSSGHDVIGFPLGPPISAMQPPKEKPPPPPTDMADEVIDDSPLKRLNSTKRIKKEIRNKRSSFLGIEGMDDDSYLEPELKLAPRPDITTFLQEESRVEKMFYKKSLYYDSDSNLGESRDSGVELDRGHTDDRWSNKQSSPDTLSEQHSRQGSEPFTITSITSEEDKKDTNFINITEDNSHYQNASTNQNMIGHQLTYKLKELEQEKMNLSRPNSEQDLLSKNRIKTLEEQIQEQQKKEIFETCNDFYDDGHSEEVLRVERELLQLEQEELKRQRDNLLYKENQVRRVNGRSLQDINMTQSCTTPLMKETSRLSYTTNASPNVNYRFSMPDLAMQQTDVSHFSNLNSVDYLNGPNELNANVKKFLPPVPPTKPSRNIDVQDREIMLRNNRTPSAEYANIDELNVRQKSTPDLSMLQNNSASHNQMSRHTLQALSAAPRSRLIPAADWLQPKRRSEPPQNYNYNQHWLIQEAEQRRLDQLRSNIKKQSQNTNQTNGTRSKHLPDAVIQTLTQRVQNMNINRPLPTPPALCPPNTPPETEKMLSVSGKKKCSHCGEELGRGAAMIIESLRLFYHLSCFQCCVCGVRLGDGRLGTDVRVRHNQLHCHNCYSSDDGVKFSCV